MARTQPQSNPAHGDVAQARRTFFDFGGAPVGQVPYAILQSWRRCRSLGLAADRLLPPVASLGRPSHKASRTWQCEDTNIPSCAYWRLRAAPRACRSSTRMRGASGSVRTRACASSTRNLARARASSKSSS